MKTIKHLLILCAAVVLLGTLLGGCVDGEKKSVASPSVGLEFQLSDDGNSYMVSGIGSCTDVDVVIPAEYEGKPVTGIRRNAFLNCKSLKGISIPDGVTRIGASAFRGCSNLSSITIPDSMTNIYNAAFSKTAYYENESNWTNGVLYIGPALIDCKTDKAGAVMVKSGTTCIANGAFAGTVNDDNRTYSGCKGLTSVTIADSVTSIGDSAFFGCSDLTSITMGNGVTSIGSNAFSGTMYYDDVSNWTDGLLYIGSALIKCSEKNANTVTIKEGTTCIADSAFYNCCDMMSITIPNSVISIGNHAFCNCNSMEDIVIPGGVTHIGYGAFSGCVASIVVAAGNACYYTNGNCLIETASKKLVAGFHNSVIPTDGSVSCIGSCSFMNCLDLTNITIPDSVTSICDSAFRGCENLLSIIIPDNVFSIGSSAFCDCPKLIRISIPDSVTGIGSTVFSGCTGLTSITLPDNVTSIGEYAFQKCTSLTSITIPDSVTSVGLGAFYGCTGLTSITIPDNVTSIGQSAFLNCTGLTSVTIPDSVTSMGYRPFSGCTGLECITFTGTKAQWEAIEKESNWSLATASFTIHCTDGDISK